MHFYTEIRYIFPYPAHIHVILAQTASASAGLIKSITLIIQFSMLAKVKFTVYRECFLL